MKRTERVLLIVVEAECRGIRAIGSMHRFVYRVDYNSTLVERTLERAEVANTRSYELRLSCSRHGSRITVRSGASCSILKLDGTHQNPNGILIFRTASGKITRCMRRPAGPPAVPARRVDPTCRDLLPE